MNTTKEKQTWLEHLSATLAETATGIGNFQVQLALGKANAADEFEKLKKGLKNTFSKQGTFARASKRQVAVIEQAIDEMLLQLTLGKAETASAFETQKKKLSAQLNKVNQALNGIPYDEKSRHTLQAEIEAAKIKLEILKLHFRFASMSEKETNEKVLALKDKIRHIRDNWELSHKLDDVEAEISRAHAHVKKAFAL